MDNVNDEVLNIPDLPENEIYEDIIERLGAENKRLLADNLRLRAELKSIEKIEDGWDGCLPECAVCEKVQEIAWRALKGM